MQLRDQRFRATVDDDECDEATARTSHTSVTPYQVAGDYDASLAIGMRVAHCPPIHFLTLAEPTSPAAGTTP